MNLSENLWKLFYDLKYNRYTVGSYHRFIIHDPKEREIQAISYRDRVVQHALCDNYLMPILERHLIFDNGACRKKKGTLFTVQRFRKFLAEHYKRYGNNGYFIQIDIKKYFNSIDHCILKEKLKSLIENERMFRLLCGIIDSYEFSQERGLPMGNQTSQAFALFF